MPWVKIDDAFYDHPKARAAGRDGRALFTAALCHSSAQLTDGFIASTDLALIAAKAEVRGPSTARRLVDAGLWETVDGGWVIHDYHAYQPSAEQEKARRRELSEVRAAAGRRGAAARWGHDNTDGKPDGKPMATGWQARSQPAGNGIAPTPNPLATTSLRTHAKGRRPPEGASRPIPPPYQPEPREGDPDRNVTAVRDVRASLRGEL
jgi:hypothetical protein